jgi:hypothetical protein
LDFENAFDMIENSTINEILKAKGFGRNGLSGLKSFSHQEHQLFSLMGCLGKNSTVGEV